MFSIEYFEDPENYQPENNKTRQNKITITEVLFALCEEMEKVTDPKMESELCDATGRFVKIVGNILKNMLTI